MSGSNPAVTENSAEKQRVALHSMLAALAMTLLKLAVGLLSGSLGVLSDAAHSGLDMVGALFTFFSVRVSDKPADEEHTYGHAKFENLSSFCEVILMAISCAWIVWEAVRRILHGQFEVLATPWTFAVVLLSIAVDLWRSRKLQAVADKTGSSALATDAFHFASDIWSSAAVLAGLVFSWIGSHYDIAALHLADPIAALAVSLLILRLTARLGYEAVSVLLDEAPKEMRLRVAGAVERIEGVLAVERTRVRRAGARSFVDMTLALPRTNTFEHNSQIVKEATAAVQLALPEADVMIHTVPRVSRRDDSIFDRVRAVAARNNIAVHDLSVLSRQGRLRVEQHVELEETLTLDEAHRFVSALEKQILHEAPEVHSVLTHMESAPATIEQPEQLLGIEEKLKESLRLMAICVAEISNVHQIRVGRTGGHITLSCHCTLPADLPMSRVQAAISQLEHGFRMRHPEVQRVNIHPEPVKETAGERKAEP